MIQNITDLRHNFYCEGRFQTGRNGACTIVDMRSAMFLPLLDFPLPLFCFTCTSLSHILMYLSSVFTNFFDRSPFPYLLSLFFYFRSIPFNTMLSYLSIQKVSYFQWNAFKRVSVLNKV